MDSTLENIPISAIQAYHTRERRLFSQMALDLCMDPTRFMEIIAFWLRLEEQKKIDFIDQIISLDDSNLQFLALIGQDCVITLRLDTPPDQLAIGFHQNAVNGTKYYVNSVCLKAFNDVRRKAEEMASMHRMEMLAHQMTCMHLESFNASQMIQSFPHGMDSVAAVRCFQPHAPNGEGSSRCINNARCQPRGILDVERGSNLVILSARVCWGQSPSTWQFHRIGHGLPFMAHNINTGIKLRRHYETTTEAKTSISLLLLSRYCRDLC